jgi:hypothetical protein
MILLQMIIHVVVRSMCRLAPKDMPNCMRVRIMVISGNAVRDHVGHRPRRAEEGLGRYEVAGVPESCIDQMALPVDGAIEIAPAPWTLM